MGIGIMLMNNWGIYFCHVIKCELIFAKYPWDIEGAMTSSMKKECTMACGKNKEKFKDANTGQSMYIVYIYVYQYNYSIIIFREYFENEENNEVMLSALSNLQAKCCLRPSFKKWTNIREASSWSTEPNTTRIISCLAGNSPIEYPTLKYFLFRKNINGNISIQHSRDGLRTKKEKRRTVKKHIN